VTGITIAANVAKLPDLIRKQNAPARGAGAKVFPHLDTILGEEAGD
jgi:hypothetical protein